MEETASPPPASRPSRLAVLVALLLLVPVGAVLLLDSRGGGELDALRADPLAGWVPPQSTGAVQTDEQDEGRPEILLEPLPGLGDREGASLVRSFRLPRGAGRAAFEAARSAAERAGWQLDGGTYSLGEPPQQRWTMLSGRKQLASGLAVLQLQTNAPAPAGEQELLTILIEHTR